MSPSAQVDEGIWKSDLPERMDPMTAKELRQNLRRGSFVYPFLGIQVLAVAAMAVEFKTGQTGERPEFPGMLNVWMLGTSGPFWAVVGGICLLVMPLCGVVLMGQELEEGNHELLQLTKLNRWKIVLGKFITLWGLSVLTFISLMPYVVVRYLVGGVEWWDEFARAATIVGGSALVCAGAIGASAFRGMGARVGVLALYLLSMFAGCGIPLVGSGAVTGGCGWHYYLTALAATFSYTLVGLALARSRLRVSIHAYEANPSGIMIGLLVCSPFGIGLITLISVGWAGFAALLGTAFIATRLDITPKASRRKPPPMPNLPIQDPA